jgi:phenylalanyl-tRNA synthetase beta chain
MKIANIRGVESQGMICAEDEIGLGEDHEGIIILPAETKVGLSAREFYRPYEDHVFEIGLTPNHMDAMSHLGVAREICAYLSNHHQKDYFVRYPFPDQFSPANNRLPISVSIEDPACGRYSGVSISGIQIRESPAWIQEKLKSIGLRPVNNIVDITNFVLHETGQPLHAFDAAMIKGSKIVVKRLPAGTKFLTLDGKERTLQAEDLMICNAEEGMCIAGVFGGLNSGVKQNTRDIFLESAWFDPISIRKTSFHHELRTDAAIHFEKGMDISGTVRALERAALLIKELAGGEISSAIIDNYPHPAPKTRVGLRYD